MLQIKVAVLSQGPVLHVVVNVRAIKGIKGTKSNLKSFVLLCYIHIGSSNDFKQFALIRLSEDRSVFETRLPQQVIILLQLLDCTNINPAAVVGRMLTLSTTSTVWLAVTMSFGQQALQLSHRQS